MRTLVLVLSLLTFLLISGVTVRLQIRAALRSYDLAEEVHRQRELSEHGEVRASRVERDFSPEQVYGLHRARGSADDCREGSQPALPSVWN